MERQQKRNWLEITILTLGIILVSTTIGILVYDMLIAEDSPPDIVVSFSKVERGVQNYALHVSAKNNGTQTAQDVVIEVRVGKGENEEASQLEFSYLPGRSTVNGWVTFEQNPSKAGVAFRVLGYSTP
jgi:uncharacterized protein (TIGR02588 family)